ncbi:hypothetical protein ACHAWC_004107 [Mediolabrus comicus]
MGKKSRRRQNKGSCGSDTASASNIRAVDGQYVAIGGAGGTSRGRIDRAHAKDPSAWAKGLSKKDQYEWLCNCYQMRCDDDYVYGGCNLHGPYNPDATPESIADDFLVFCILAKRARAFPSDWDMEDFLKTAPEYIVFAFEKSDAKERWGSENYFEAEMGGRSLRYTAEKIYKSGVQQQGDSLEHTRAEEEVNEQPRELQDQLGGTGLWEGLVVGLQNSKRFKGLEQNNEDV